MVHSDEWLIKKLFNEIVCVCVTLAMHCTAWQGIGSQTTDRPHISRSVIYSIIEIASVLRICNFQAMPALIRISNSIPCRVLFFSLTELMLFDVVIFFLLASHHKLFNTVPFTLLIFDRFVDSVMLSILITNMKYRKHFISNRMVCMMRKWYDHKYAYDSNLSQYILPTAALTLTNNGKGS